MGTMRAGVPQSNTLTIVESVLPLSNTLLLWAQGTVLGGNSLCELCSRIIFTVIRWHTIVRLFDKMETNVLFGMAMAHQTVKITEEPARVGLLFQRPIP